PVAIRLFGAFAAAAVVALRFFAVHFQDLLFYRADDGVVLIGIFEKVGNVKKGVPFEADIDKRRLHSRQNTGYATFMNATRERVFFGSLVENFHELVIFE